MWKFVSSNKMLTGQMKSCRTHVSSFELAAVSCGAQAPARSLICLSAHLLIHCFVFNSTLDVWYEVVNNCANT